MLKKILRLLLKSIAIITLVAVGVLAGLFAFDRLVVQPENNRTAAAVLATLPTDVALLELVDRQHKNPLADRLYASLIYKNSLLFNETSTLTSNAADRDEYMRSFEIDDLCQTNLFLQQYRPYAIQEHYADGSDRDLGRLMFAFGMDVTEQDLYRMAMKMQPYYIQRLKRELKQTGMHHNVQNIDCLLEMKDRH